MNYETMWFKLMAEIEDLADKHVEAISPVVVLAYMDFVDQLAKAEQPECKT